MRAIVIERNGGVEVFEEKELSSPEATPGHVVVDVRATSVNPLDMKLRRAAMPFSRPFPQILHGDVAGVVRAVGPGVTTFKVGDEVYGCAGGVKGTPSGALAEHMLADARLLAHKPKSLSFGDAAALPLVAITTWEALIDRLEVRAGDKLLVHGGVGGVGHFAVQMGAWLGADVSSTVSNADDMKTVLGFGARYAINYKTTAVEDYVAEQTGGRGFDHVFETVGGENMQKSFAAIRYVGKIASIATGGQHEMMPLYVKGGTLHSVLMLLPMLTGEGREHHGKILAKTAELVDRGKLRPLVDPRRFTFGEIKDAHAHLESGKAYGKVIIERR
jgi:NADPH2:quinone reductase